MKSLSFTELEQGVTYRVVCFDSYGGLCRLDTGEICVAETSTHVMVLCKREDGELYTIHQGEESYTMAYNFRYKL